MPVAIEMFDEILFFELDQVSKHGFIVTFEVSAKAMHAYHFSSIVRSDSLGQIIHEHRIGKGLFEQVQQFLFEHIAVALCIVFVD